MADWLGVDVDNPTCPIRVCELCGGQFTAVLGKRFCSAECRRRASWKREQARSDDFELLGALVKRYDEHGQFIEEPWPTAVLCRVSSALAVPRCPVCKGILRKLDTDDMDVRDCAVCRVRVRLNEEEVSWVISERRMTGA